MTTDENKRIARRVPEDIATEKNLAVIEEIFAEDFVEHGRFGEEIRGLAALEESFEAVFAAFPDFEARVEDVIAEGDLVAMRVTLSGTQDGEFMGFEPTGKSFEVQNMVFTRIENGKIAERWVQPDTFGMFRQLGIIESPVA